MRKCRHEVYVYKKHSTRRRGLRKEMAQAPRGCARAVWAGCRLLGQGAGCSRGSRARGEAWQQEKVEASVFARVLPHRTSRTTAWA